MSARGFWWSARGLRLRAATLFALSMGMLAVGLLPGLAGHGLAGFAAMAAVFVWMRLLAKPWLLSGLSQAGGWRRLVSDLGGQVLVALVLFWLGTAAALIWVSEGSVNFWLPPALALAAGSLSRLIWRPMPPEWDGFLEDAVARITATDVPSSPAAPAGRPHAAALEQLHSALDRLPAQGAKHHDLLAALTAALQDMTPEDLRHSLHERIFDATSERDLRALVVAHTDPYIAQHFLGQHDLEEIFDLIVEANDQPALTHFIAGVTAVLDSVPEACNDLPTPHRLRQTASGLPDPLGAELTRFAAHVQRLREEHPEA